MALDPRRAARLSPVDITTTAFAHDPLPGYAELRAKCPVSWHTAGRYWAVTRYRDASALLRDPRLRSVGVLTSWTRLRDRYGADFPTILEIFSRMPFNYDGEHHALLRRVIARAIAPLADLDAAFRRVVDRLLARARADGGFDLAEDFANRILFEIVCDLAAIPLSSRASLYPMSRLSWAIDTTISLPRRRAAEELLKGVHATLVAETRRQVAAQSDSLIGRLYQELPDDGDRISATAALISVILMMGSDALGGTVTTAVRGLIDPAPRRPPSPQAQWADVSDDALRYSATVDYLIRVANEPVAIDGMTIVAGEIMVISPLAANHDSHEFGEDADMVSATRNHGVGLAFGAGVHVCVGMRMARNIAREVFSGLAAMPRLRLTGPYRPANGIVVRSAESLPIAID